MSTQVDLRRLAVHREQPGGAGATRVRRHFLARYLLPGLILLGFAAVMGWAARDTLLPAKDVTVVPVLVDQVRATQEGAPLFSAAGWIEPRPTAIQVTALAPGVIEKMLVVEGQEVKADEPVAQLIDIDARLALEDAKADLRLKEAECEGAEAMLAASKTNLSQPLRLQAELADAEAMLAKSEGEQANLMPQIRASEARLRLAKQELDGKTSVADAVSARVVQRAQSEYDAAQAVIDELRARMPRLEQEVQANQRKRDSLTRQLELLTDEKSAVAEASADCKSAQARRQQAEVAVQKAELTLERMTVRAPRGGRVLGLTNQPGGRVMGLAPESEHDASTVCRLYDPTMLQVRADVRLEDVPRVESGGRVRIETAAAGKPLFGEVLRVTSSADIQKNTLQVKVSIDDPPPVIKPEMLVQVTFLAGKSADENIAIEQQRVYVPKALVESGEHGQHMWIADQAAGVARHKTVKVGRAVAGDLVEVEGLTAADKLIDTGRESLTDGARIRITGEGPSH